MVEPVIAKIDVFNQCINRHDRFLQIIEQYEPALHRLTAAYLDRKTDREDLFQEIALALWQAIPMFRGDASQRTWLYRIAHNVAISFAAKYNRHGKREESMTGEFDCPSSARDAEYNILREEKRRLLLDSIRSLPTADRQIMLLYLEGLEYTEIEEVSGLSEAAIATRLTRIREKLKGKIQGKEAGRNAQSR